VKAVGIDEEITGRVGILSVRPDKPICELATTIRNGDGEVVLSGLPRPTPSR